MLNERALHAVASARQQNGDVHPLYASYCFRNLPSLIRFVLLGDTQPAMPLDVLGELPQRHQIVLTILFDALGWQHIEPRLAAHPLLQRALREGVISKLTAMFPSTTTAHLIGFFSDLPPAQSGFYEWFQYEPQLNRIITPLYFSYAGDRERGTLGKNGVQPESIYPQQSFLQPLHAGGVSNYLVQPAWYAQGPVTALLKPVATLVGYRTLADGLAQAARLIAKHRAEGTPAFIWLYADGVDDVAHNYGPSADSTQAEVEAALAQVEHVLMPRIRGSGALVLLTADHGQIDANPKRTYYLNQLVPDFESYLLRGSDGRPLAPAGSPRDLFLHVKPDLLEAARDRFAEALGNAARVLPTRILIEAGLFGPEPTTVFLERVGNLVVLPAPGETVYIFEKDRFEQKYYGHHGGLSPQEMEIPLIALLA
ncbi:MAG: alkaline phosphatase family protein [Anaerolineae bacterium]|nr:alkaline phosphatase family protein [Anaerolineae bacterium]